MKTKLLSQIIVLCCTITAPLLLTGCTPEKARAAQNAAIQFKNEAHIAINTIELAIKKEIEPVPKPESESNEEFVKRILSLAAETEVDETILEMAIDPYSVDLSDGTSNIQSGFIASLKSQYASLEAIFDGVEAGSYFARDAIEETVPIVRKLTAQMAAMSEKWAEAPPMFLQYRSSILGRVQDIRTSEATPEDKRTQLLLMKEEWTAVKNDEKALQKEVVHQCLKAAIYGKELIKILEQYGDLDLQAIQDTLSIAIDRAGKLTGKDFSELEGKADSLLNDIKSDPEMKALIENVLIDLQTPDSETDIDLTSINPN